MKDVRRVMKLLSTIHLILIRGSTRFGSFPAFFDSGREELFFFQIRVESWFLGLRIYCYIQLKEKLSSISTMNRRLQIDTTSK